MRSRAKKIAYTSVMVCVALMLSYLEALIPYLPIPGFKPGLANLSTMVAYLLFGLPTAISVSICRIALSAILFGSPLSLLFSVSGGIASLLAIAAFNTGIGKFFGMVGLGVSSAAMHCVGQCVSASILYGISILFSYLPWLLLLSVPTGILTGELSGIIARRLISRPTETVAKASQNIDS